MHPCLSVDEILRLIACELVASRAKRTAVALACCCKSSEDPTLDALWETQDGLLPLLKSLPGDVWRAEAGQFVSRVMAFIFSALKRLVQKSFERIPTKAEWCRFRKYAQRIQILNVDTSDDSMTPEVLLALQLRTTNKPFLPRLRTFECTEATEAFIPFIPLLLSPKTIEITIAFAQDSPTVAVASVISRFPSLCPDLEYINLSDLPKNSVITNAVSEMVLGCNRDCLQVFQVDSPLTEEAREVVYQLPRLTHLWGVFEGPTSLPAVMLPELTAIDVECEDDLSWLRGFRGARLEKLESVGIGSEHSHIGDFLGEFEGVARTTTAQNTLSRFEFRTSRPWNPNYRALLSFRHLKQLEIDFSCHDSCSSTIDDDMVADLTRAMPKLEILRLGEDPCKTPTGVTVNGLIGLAHRCPHLSELRIHFQAASLVDTTVVAATQSLSDHEPVVQRRDCALTDLEVGEIPIPAQSGSKIPFILLQIFPHILNVVYTNEQWKTVAETVNEFRQISAFVHRSGKAHPSHPQLSLVMDYQEMQ